MLSRDLNLRAFLARDSIAYLQSLRGAQLDRKSTRLNSSHLGISYAVFCLKKKIKLATVPSGRLRLRPSAHRLSPEPHPDRTYMTHHQRLSDASFASMTKTQRRRHAIPSSI